MVLLTQFVPMRINGGGYMRDYPEGVWPPNVTTLGRVLKNAGYKTAQFGKLEAGIPMPAGKMTEHGWDTWMGFSRWVQGRSA